MKIKPILYLILHVVVYLLAKAIKKNNLFITQNRLWINNIKIRVLDKLSNLRKFIIKHDNERGIDTDRQTNNSTNKIIFDNNSK